MPLTSLDGSRVGLLIVGDELLSGKRRDSHLQKVIELLSTAAWRSLGRRSSVTTKSRSPTHFEGRASAVTPCSPAAHRRNAGRLHATGCGAGLRRFDRASPGRRDPDRQAVRDKAHPHRVLMADFRRPS